VAERDPNTEARTYRYVAAGMLDEIQEILGLEEVMSNGVRAIPVRHQHQYTGGAFALFATVARAWIEAEAALEQAGRALEQERRRSGILRRIFRQRMREWRRYGGRYSYCEEDVEQFLVEAEREALASSPGEPAQSDRLALLEAVASAELGVDGDPVPDEDLRAYLTANDIPVPGAAETETSG
jgi:hypothetical protein